MNFKLAVLIFRSYLPYMKMDQASHQNAEKTRSPRMLYGIAAGMFLLAVGLLLDNGTIYFRTSVLMGVGLGIAILSVARYFRK